MKPVDIITIFLNACGFNTQGLQGWEVKERTDNSLILQCNFNYSTKAIWKRYWNKEGVPSKLTNTRHNIWLVDTEEENNQITVGCKWK
jgi:hypothetical protein